ncbi:MAG: ABC transporter ATP-binding protein [Planctomycetaceae bacterium]|nr:MAG: ABC transporter ATP-binding protein [Planctomycetaceae bacterium]
MCAQPVVVIEHLTKRYGQFTALDDLNLTIEAGQILGLIGPNGAGKTTTIRILVGLARPTSGRASIAGIDCVTQADKIRHLVGYMPDKFGAYDNMRVHEYLDFFGAAFGIPPRKRRQRIDEVLQITRAEHLRDKYVESLSHGMGQRVGIARTLLHDPQVLILDEPANGLDPQARIEMRELLLELAAQGKTLLVTSHILPELARICHRMAILTHGRLRAWGTVEEIGRQVSHQRTIEVQLVCREQLPMAVTSIRSLVEPQAEVTEAPAEQMVRFRTALPEEQLAHVVEQLVRQGIRFSQFRELQTDLEEAFLTFARPVTSETKGQESRPVGAVVRG